MNTKYQTSEDFAESLVKGRIAETIIERLFVENNFTVFHYGMENTIPNVMKFLKGKNDEVSQRIRKLPDLVVWKDKKPYFIEVKYSKNEEFPGQNIKEYIDYPYQNTYFILVSKKHIKCISYNELKAGKVITADTSNYLSNIAELNLKKETIIKYCEMAEKFYKNIT